MLELWRKRPLSDRLYKTKEEAESQISTDCTRPKRKQNHKFGDDDDSINLPGDIEDDLILSMDSSIES